MMVLLEAHKYLVQGDVEDVCKNICVLNRTLPEHLIRYSSKNSNFPKVNSAQTELVDALVIFLTCM